MGHSTMNFILSKCLFLGLAILLVGLEATPQSRNRAPSPIVNCGCQCTNLSYRDENGKVHGNCQSDDDAGAKWCYVGAESPCQDIQTTDKGPHGQDWSYEACATPVCDDTDTDSLMSVGFKKNTEFAIARDQKIVELLSMGKQFIVTFELLLTNVATSGWTSVIHFTIGGNAGNYGDRTPAVFISNGKTVHMTMAINGNPNYWTNIDELTLTTNKWYKFELSQLLIGKEYRFIVEIDDKTYINEANNQAERFDNVAVFAADDYFDTAPGKLKNVIVKTIKTLDV